MSLYIYFRNAHTTLSTLSCHLPLSFKIMYLTIHSPNMVHIVTCHNLVSFDGRTDLFVNPALKTHLSKITCLHQYITQNHIISPTLCAPILSGRSAYPEVKAACPLQYIASSAWALPIHTAVSICLFIPKITWADEGGGGGLGDPQSS